MILVGVDGGATRTRALALDTETGLASAAAAGPSNPVNVGACRAAHAIAEAVEEASRPLGRPSLVYAGLAGLDSRLVAEEASAGIQRCYRGPGRLVIDHDAYIALVAAAGRARPAEVVIAGTGSIAFAVDASGRRIIVGDHGWLLGDEGSGFWVARRALRRLLRVLDGREPGGCLANALARGLGVADADELAYWFYRNRGSVEEVAAAARLVSLAAAEGCGEAEELLREAARTLAEAAVHAAHASGARVVYMSGSMFSSRHYREEFEAALEAEGLVATPTPRPPVLGALHEALRLAGLDPARVLGDDRLAATASKLYS